MSVIFGIKEDNEIIIAGDKRGTNMVNGSFVDNTDKLIVINEYLAFVSAGNHAIETAINMDLSKVNTKQNMTTDDLLDVIKAFYQRVNDTEASTILAMPFCFLITGKGRYNGASLISGCNIRGKFSAQEVPMALYPPQDISNAVCCQIFAKHYNLNHKNFVEKTIYEISEKGQFVSAKGDKWIYDIKTERGVLHTF